MLCQNLVDAYILLPIIYGESKHDCICMVRRSNLFQSIISLKNSLEPRSQGKVSLGVLFFFFCHITLNGLKEGARCHSNLKKKLISLENGPNTANKMKIV